MGYLLQYQSHVEDLTSLAGNPEDISWLIPQPVEQPLRASLQPLGDLVGDFTSGVVVAPDDGSAFIQASDPPLQAPRLLPLGISVGDYSSDAANPTDTSWLTSFPDSVPRALVGPALGWFAGDISSADAPGFVSIGMPFYWATASRPTNVQPFLEVFLRATSGTAYARLFDITANVAVGGTTLSTAVTNFRRMRPGSASTLSDATEYQVQVGTIGADTGEIKGARLVVIYP